MSARGELEVSTPGGGFHDAAPISYQEIDGKQVEVATRYALTKNRTNAADAGDAFTYGFDLAAYRSSPRPGDRPDDLDLRRLHRRWTDDRGYDIAVGPSAVHTLPAPRARPNSPSPMAVALARCLATMTPSTADLR